MLGVPLDDDEEEEEPTFLTRGLTAVPIDLGVPGNAAFEGVFLTGEDIGDSSEDSSPLEASVIV